MEHEQPPTNMAAMMSTSAPSGKLAPIWPGYTVCMPEVVAALTTMKVLWLNRPLMLVKIPSRQSMMLTTTTRRKTHTA